MSPLVNGSGIPKDTSIYFKVDDYEDAMAHYAKAFLEGTVKLIGRSKAIALRYGPANQCIMPVSS